MVEVPGDTAGDFVPGVLTPPGTAAGYFIHPSQPP
jgi:hypothetical protein